MEKALREVLTFLRSQTGRDFTCYKRATILRRLARRMQVNGVHDLPGYLDFLRTHPGDTAALHRDLLISVTNFFRDREAFVALAAQIPELFAGKGTADVVRVWVAACATGEEAYSIAMLLSEHAALLESPPSIQVFATDLDEAVSSAARAALYPLTISADVSEDRLRRFFDKELTGFRVRRELRERVLFAVHDLLKDSPFSRLDLVSCRNLLIYLDRAAQRRAFQVFHFALRSGARLFPGSSETMDDGSPLFTLLDAKHRLYAQRPSARGALPLPIGKTTLHRAFEARERTRSGPVVHGAGQAAGPATLGESDSGVPPRASWEEMHFRLIERFAPPSVIVDRDYNMAHVSENAGRFLRIAGGEPSVNLLKVVHPSLRVELRAALFRAAQTDTEVEVFRVPMETETGRIAVDLRVAPAQEIAPDFLLVVFSPRDSAGSPEAEALRLEAEPAARHLEREVEHLKTRLRDTVEQYEAGAEELQASNEELQAMNEELHSATEELETGREALHSINEELTTVNQDMKGKVDELSQSNSDLQNLMAATELAIVFLDRDLSITRYTPAAVELFHLIPGDIGRPLSDLRHQLDYPDIKDDAKRVLRSLIPREREIADGTGRWFLSRLLPYRSKEDHIAGVVISFIDITERRAAEIALRESEERLRLVLGNAREYAIVSTDLERRVTTWNTGAERILGYAEAEIIGQPADVIFTPEDRAAHAPEAESSTAIATGSATNERWHLRKDGSRFWGSGVMMAMHDSAGQPVGLVKIFRDKTAEREGRMALEKSRQDLLEALQDNECTRAEAVAAGKAKDHFLAVLSHELRTPLTPALMICDMLLDGDDLSPLARDGLETIRRNVELEAHFIDDLLDVSRISHGKLEMARAPLDLHEAIRAAVEITRPEIAAKTQTLTVELAAAPSAVRGDPARLQQVFWNLLKNAAKFTPADGTLRIATRNEAGCIVVEVSDTGCGIDPTALANIFEAFRQGDVTITREFGGLGLGLAISKATVDAHGGSISASSQGRGQGTIFTVKIPLLDPAAETPE